MTIDWTKPAAELLEELKASSMVKTGHKIRFNDIEEAFPNTGYRSIVATSVSNAAKVDAEANIVLIAASGPDGADLSDATSQSKILFIATSDNWPEGLLEWVKARCVRKVYTWETEGFTTEPTLAEIEVRRSEKAEEIHRQKARLAGVRFGEQFAIGDDPAAKMAAIWEAI